MPLSHLSYSVCPVFLLGSSNVGNTLPSGQLSTIPWRRAAVKYTNNEAYFDVVEEIDAILDKSGIFRLHFLTVKMRNGPNMSFFFCTYQVLKVYTGFIFYLFFSFILGTTVFAEIQGVIDACVKLSGMPDLTLSFMVSYVFLYHVTIQPLTFTL